MAEMQSDGFKCRSPTGSLEAYERSDRDSMDKEEPQGSQPSRIYPLTLDSTRRIPIGGPGTILPFWLESLCSWILAVCCLGVALYFWTQQMILDCFSFIGMHESVLPLTTHSRYELNGATGLDRYHQLVRYLRIQHCKLKDIEEWTDDDWIRILRSDQTARRLLSLLRLKINDLPETLRTNSMVNVFIRVWPHLLALPNSHGTFPYEITVVTAAYKENVSQLLSKLQHALDAANLPEKIQWILVDAGHNPDLEEAMSKLPHVQLMKGTSGGRGPSLNQGASVATGRILLFLHADTRVAQGWDVAVQNAFDNSTDLRGATTTTATAFSFAIDTTEKGLQGGCPPPGIKAIETTANWRTQLFSLPYGDQCISIPRVYFDYLGGYPHQSLMEDYELISLLRRRRVSCRERLTILPLSAHCGPRRWQAFGVLYVTYTNSKCVRLYAKNVLTPDELYEIYYGSTVNTVRSPWETELELLLSRDEKKVR